MVNDSIQNFYVDRFREHIFQSNKFFFTKYLRNLAGANVSCILDVEIFSSNSKELGSSIKNYLVFNFERKSKIVYQSFFIF